jgi:outer membrane receptor protein involved in Fe transport
MHDAMENVQLSDGSLQTRNGGTESAYGVEAEIQKEWRGGSSLRGYATYTWAASHGDELTQSPRWTVGGALLVPLLNQKLYLAVRPQFVGAMKSDLGEKTDPTFITTVVLTSKDIVKGWDLQAGAYNLFANSAKLPRDGAFNQYQPTLNYPDTLFLVSMTHRF